MYSKYVENVNRIKSDIFVKTMVIEDKINNTDLSWRYAYLTLASDISYIGSGDIKIDEHICHSLNSSNIDIIAKLVKPKDLDNNIIDKKTENEFLKNFNEGVFLIKKECKIQ